MRTRMAIVMGAVLSACGAGEFEVREEPVETQQAALQPRVASYAGNTLVQGALKNDAAWFVNMPNSLRPLSTQLTLTLTHGGSLQTGYGKLGHIAISIRGASAEGAFAQLNWPLQTGSHFFGEDINAAFDKGTISQSNYLSLVMGRGITFWPVGTGFCPIATRPCAIFENYTSHALHGGGLMTSGAMALDVSSAPFDVKLVGDNHDTFVTVTQNGVQKLNVSCRRMTGNDSRCGATAGNVGLADAFVAFVAGPAPVMEGYTVGATRLGLRHELDDLAPCPGCPIP